MCHSFLRELFKKVKKTCVEFKTSIIPILPFFFFCDMREGQFKLLLEVEE